MREREKKILAEGDCIPVERSAEQRAKEQDETWRVIVGNDTTLFKLQQQQQQLQRGEEEGRGIVGQFKTSQEKFNAPFLSFFPLFFFLVVECQVDKWFIVEQPSNLIR